MAAEQRGLQPQVFISHTAAADDEGRIFAASILKPALEAANVKVFFDDVRSSNNNDQTTVSLQPGCEWPAQLVKEAATSAVFVVVLTQPYATRSWCLRELDLALHGHPDHPRGNAKPLIIPVYYDHHSLLQQVSVEQLQVDRQRRLDRLTAAGAQGSAEWQDLQCLDLQRMLQNIPALQQIQAVRRQHQRLPQQQQPLDQLLQQHLSLEQLPPPPPPPPQQQQQSLELLQQQQPAVAGSSSSRGPWVHPPKDEEWQLARRLVATALQHLPANQRLAYIEPGLVGYEAQLAELTAQLTVDEPGKLGLWLYGPGGLGKTTLAHLLYNTLLETKKFTKAVIVELDLEGSSKEKLKCHLLQLLQDLGVSQPKGSNTQLLQSLAQVVQEEKVLMLLDNVNNDSQLNGLLPPAFSSGSRVIITSRKERLLSTTFHQAAGGFHHHRIDTLNTDSACVMFRRCHALDQQQLQQLELNWLEKELLEACSGLPLALQVIGGSLRVDGANNAEWATKTCKRWQEVSSFSHGRWTPTDVDEDSSEAKLQGVVYYSLSNLSDAPRNMFLDSVSVLQGQSLFNAMLVWEAWWPDEAQRALDKLKQMSLISSPARLYDSYDPPSIDIFHERLTTLDVIRTLGQSILLKPDRADRLGDKYVGSRVWVNSKGEVQGLIEDKKPLGVNLTEHRGFARVYHTLQGHLVHNPKMLDEVRILISHDLPTRVLTHAPHLMWIGRIRDCCDPPRYPLVKMDWMVHKWVDPIPKPAAASRTSYTATGADGAHLLPKLVVVELRVSALRDDEAFMRDA